MNAAKRKSMSDFRLDDNLRLTFLTWEEESWQTIVKKPGLECRELWKEGREEAREPQIAKRPSADGKPPYDESGALSRTGQREIRHLLAASIFALRANFTI
jgi:hypothetical protein